jgi:short-subunit dehydrogenase
LRDTSISVSVLIPGSTDTDFVNRARMSAEVKRTAEKFNMKPDLVGKIAVRGLFKRKAEIVPGFSNKLHAFFPRFFPKSVVEKLGGNIYKPKTKNATSIKANEVRLAINKI